MPNEETDEKLNTLEKRISELENEKRIRELEKGFQLSYPLDNTSKKIIQDASIRDIVLFLETNSTPVAVTGSGKIFTRSDNTLWFQDADGTIKRINLT